MMRETIADRYRGTQWSVTSALEDLDFADGTTVLSIIYSGSEEKMDRLATRASNAGLRVNIKANY